MALIAKRRLAETWREAVAARAGAAGRDGEAVSIYDRLRAEGRHEAEAAFHALGHVHLLWSVDLPGDPQAPTPRPAGMEEEVPVD